MDPADRSYPDHVDQEHHGRTGTSIAIDITHVADQDDQNGIRS
ncbi:hypothetical protein [Pseudonocardia humida]|nr:hypothetical protein [Pseudonocardia humida]